MASALKISQDGAFLTGNSIYIGSGVKITSYNLANNISSNNLR